MTLPKLLKVAVCAIYVFGAAISWSMASENKYGASLNEMNKALTKIKISEFSPLKKQELFFIALGERFYADHLAQILIHKMPLGKDLKLQERLSFLKKNQVSEDALYWEIVLSEAQLSVEKTLNLIRLVIDRNQSIIAEYISPEGLPSSLIIVGFNENKKEAIVVDLSLGQKVINIDTLVEAKARYFYREPTAMALGMCNII